MHVPSNAAKEHQQQHEEEEYKYGPSADAHNAGSSSNSGGKDSKADGGDSITSGGQFDHYSLTLTCFAPDGSPIQGTESNGYLCIFPVHIVYLHIYLHL